MSPTQIVCADCGATQMAGHERCWLCHGAQSETRSASPNLVLRSARPVSPWQFSLESLFLLTTLVAVSLGVFLIAPGLGVLLAIVTIPALARTFIASYRKKQADVQLSAAQKVSAFFLSFMLLLAIGYAGCIAFFFVCLGTGLAALAAGADGEGAFAAVLILSGLVAASFVGWLLWLSRPKAA